MNHIGDMHNGRWAYSAADLLSMKVSQSLSANGLDTTWSGWIAFAAQAQMMIINKWWGHEDGTKMGDWVAFASLGSESDRAMVSFNDFCELNAWRETGAIKSISIILNLKDITSKLPLTIRDQLDTVALD